MPIETEDTRRAERIGLIRRNQPIIHRCRQPRAGDYWLIFGVALAAGLACLYALLLTHA